MEEVHRILETIQRTNQRAVLATIIHVEGHAYLKEGASMLFLEDGSQIGLLSAGCLEADLAAHVPELLETGFSRGFVFDLQSSDPLSWGEEPGCDGVVHVTMEPINNELLGHLCTLKDHLDQRTEVMLVKNMNSDGAVADYGFVTGNRYLFGKWRGEFPQDLLEIIASEPSQRSGMKAVCSTQMNVFVHTYYPKPRLFIFGAGQDARPVAALAAATGFSVIVSDWRHELCDSHYFPDAESLILGFPEEAIGRIHFTPHDYAIVMTHNFVRDQQLVRFLSQRQLCYLGILGSKHRAARLLNGELSPTHVHIPVGLAIGAEGPVEIAVSILADLIYTYRKNRKREVASNEA